MFTLDLYLSASSTRRSISSTDMCPYERTGYDSDQWSQHQKDTKHKRHFDVQTVRALSLKWINWRKVESAMKITVSKVIISKHQHCLLCQLLIHRISDFNLRGYLVVGDGNLLLSVSRLFNSRHI